MNTKFRGQAEPSPFRDESLPAVTAVQAGKPDQYIVTLRHSRLLTSPRNGWL